MKIQIDTADIGLGTAQTDEIKRVLRLKNDTELSARLQALAKASLDEYASMIVERGMPTRADEARQDRLFKLIKYVFSPYLPGEAIIASVFHLPVNPSRTLLKNTLSRYRAKLQDALLETMKDVLRRAAPVDGTDEPYYVVIDSEVIKDELNMIVAQSGPTLAPIKRRSESLSQWEIRKDTYDLLMKELKP